MQGVTQGSAYSGVMAGTGTLTYAGSGTLTMSGINTYSGLTTISSGTLALSGSGAIASSAVSDNGTFDISAVTTGATINGLSGTGAVTLGGKALTVQGVTQGSAYSGVMAGTGTLTYAGSGTLTMSGANTYSGLTTISSGTLALSGAGSLASSAVSDNSTFDISAVTTGTTINGLSGTGGVTLGSKTLTVQGVTQGSAYSGVMAGTGALTYAGTGTLTMSGVNTYSGLTTISSGTLALSGSGAIASSAVSDNGTFDISAVTTGATINGLSGTGAVTLGAKALTVQGGTQGSAYSGVMAGTRTLTYAGTGTLTMSGANTYSGLTTITSGILALSGGGSLASSAVNDNSTFDISAVTTGTTINGLSGTGGVTLGAKTLTVQGVTQGSAYSGVMAGTGALTYAGSWHVNDVWCEYLFRSYHDFIGTLALSGSGAIASSAVNDNGTFDISAVNGSHYKWFKWTGGVTLGGKALTVQGGARKALLIPA